MQEEHFCIKMVTGSYLHKAVFNTPRQQTINYLSHSDTPILERPVPIRFDSKQEAENYIDFLKTREKSKAMERVIDNMKIVKIEVQKCRTEEQVRKDISNSKL